MHSIRQPRYTGKNRCLPCTAVNVVIAIVVSLLLAGLSVFAGVTAFFVFLALIYLRGYLVPGTPEVTKRYLPTSLLLPFGKEPESATMASEFERLRSLGIVVPRNGSSGESTRLTPEFRSAWRTRIETVDPEEITSRDIANLFGVDADDVSSIDERAFVVCDTRLVNWPSAAALVADVAAGAELNAHDRGGDEWNRMGPGARQEMLTCVRAFLSDCPTCGTPLTRETHRVTSCCQPSKNVFASTCEGCGAHIIELDVTEEG